MVNEEAVNAVHAAICEESLADCLDPDWRGRCVKAVEAAAPHIKAQALTLLRELTDPDDCWFDHHGGCQAHGYLSLKPGQTCPQQDAKDLVRAAEVRGQG